MRYAIIIIALPLLAFCQEFEFEMEYESIPLEVDGYDIPVPWTGGYSYSSPAFCDLDADIDFDLFLGRWSEGYIAYYENIGTPNSAVLILVEENFQTLGIGPSSATPFFTDIDNDGDFDLFVDWWNVPIKFFINSGNPASPLFELGADTLRDVSGNYIDGTDLCLIDIDADGDEDLFVGVWYTGTIKFYDNIGDSIQYIFSLADSAFAGVNTGYWSSPVFCDTDADHDFDLFVGDANGKIWYCNNEGSPAVYNFANPVQNWLGIDVGDYASPEFCDIDGDGDYDLFMGKENDLSPTPPGAIHFWQNNGTPEIPDFVEITQSYLTFDVGKSGRVNLCDIDIDGDLDLFFNSTNYLGWMENTGSVSNPSFLFHTYNLIGYFSPTHFDLADLNGDDLPDLVGAAGYTGILTLYYNTGIPGQVVFEEIGQLDTDYVINTITLADMDDDGDKDLLFGGYESYPSGNVLVYYENQGSQTQPNFVFITDNYHGIASSYIATISPCLADADMDFDYDLFLMDNQYSLVWFFENVGNPQQAQFDSITNNFLGYDLEASIYIDLGDMDDDGDMDAFGGRWYGGINFFRNVTGQNEVGPKRPIGPPLPQLDFIIGPNPANPVTWISFSLPAPQEATVAVYNILGAKVVTLASGLQMPGTHNYIWNASQYSSGVYIIRLETTQFTSSQRVMVVK